MSLIIRILFAIVVVLSLVKENEGGDGEEDHPGRARYFRFSQHRQRNVQPNEFYQLSMNANLVACGGGIGNGNGGNNDDEDVSSSGEADGEEATAVTTIGIDGCQHKIVAEIYIETTTTTRGHRSWDTHDMHLHFLLDEVYLPDNGTYGRPEDPFAVNVTLEVTYARYQLQKVQVLNCYVTRPDQSDKSTVEAEEEEEDEQQESSKQNTNEMVSSPSPPLQDREQDNADGGKFSESAETKNQDYITEEPNGVEENEEEEEEFHEDDGEGLQGNAAEVYDDGVEDSVEDDDDYETDADNGHTWSGNDDEDHVIHKITSFSQTNHISINSKIFHPAWARKMNNENQHFPNRRNHHHFSHTNQDGDDSHAARVKLQLTSTNPRTTAAGHDGDAGGGHYRWRHQSPAIKDANGSHHRRPQSYFDNNHHPHVGGSGGARPSRAYRQGMQLKRFGIYKLRAAVPMDLEYSSVVSIANGKRNESAIVESTRLTSSSNIYVNQISSIKFQAATVVSTSGRKPRMTTTGKDHQRQGHQSVKAPITTTVSGSHRKNNLHRSTPSTSTSKSNRYELMLIDPSELSDLSSSSWQEGSSEEFFEHDQGNGVEKLLWGGEKRSVRKSSFPPSEEEGGEEDLSGGRLICPELGPQRQQVKAESIRSYFGGGSRTRLRHCPREEELLCLEAPVAVAVAYKYEIQLTYSLDRVAPMEPAESHSATHHRNRIKITNIITSFHGPMVNESSSVGSARKRTPPIDGTTQVDNIMLLELALVNLGHQQKQQEQQHHRSELVRVNIDTDCLSYLSSIAVEKSNAAQKSMDVRLWPDRLRTVRFQFRINATAAAGHNLEFPCTATAALVRSQPSKNPTRPRRHSTNHDDYLDDNSQEQQQQQQPEPSSRIVVVAERKFLIKPGARCVCSDFACRCTCLLGMVSPTAAESQSTPGAVAATSDGSCQMVITFGGAAGATTTGDHHHQHHRHQRSGFWHWIYVLLMLLLLVLLLLGCVKAMLGCCSARIGRWRYDFLQPTVRYKDASSYRRFLINLIFFLVYPCVLCCRCFERPDGEANGDGGDFGDEERDHLLQQQGRLKGAMVVQKQLLQPSTTTTTITSSTEEDDEQDEDILGDGWDSGGARAWSINNGGTTDDELSKLLTEQMQQQQQSDEGGSSRVGAGGGGRKAYYNNTEDEDNDMKFVLDVMNRSRKSLQTLVR